METEQGPRNPLPSASESPAFTPRASKLRYVFVGPKGIRAGWRLVLVVALLAVLRLLIIQHGLPMIPGFLQIAKATQGNGVLTPQFQLLLHSAALLVVFLAAGVMAKI